MNPALLALMLKRMRDRVLAQPHGRRRPRAAPAASLLFGDATLTVTQTLAFAQEGVAAGGPLATQRYRR